MRRKLAEERERLESTPAPVLNPRQIDVAFAAERGSTLVLDAKGLAKSFGERVVLEPFDLEIRHGEAVGLVGANGSGKTTLFRIVRGEEPPSAGTLRLGPSVVVGYYAQEQETLDPTATPMEVVRALKPMTEQAAIGFLNRYLFTRDDMLGRIGGLSGGQRARLQIAALILRGANFLLLDEPTNNLDIPSVERLEEALLAFLDEGQGTILTISHDRAFLDTVCGRIVELDDGVVRDYAGGFTWYDEHRGRGRELTIRPPAPPPPPRRGRRDKRPLPAPV
jgi:ATP-binding cassette subfamily F protein 3